MRTTRPKVRLIIRRGRASRPTAAIAYDTKRVEAVERLIALLERSAFPARPHRIGVRPGRVDTRSLLERLRAARAVYVLSSGVVARTGPGAYTRASLQELEE